MSNNQSTPIQKRHIRTSNPTPPERVDIKKARSEPFDSLSDSETNSSNNNEMADAIEFVQPLLSQKMSITEEDIIKISKAVKAEILADINKLIHARTEPLVQKISKLEIENKQLQKDLDALEQYGRRSLIRISGLSERATGDETTTAVRKIMSEIDPDHKPEDVIRSHWVGKSSGPQVSHRKPRQIIVRLSDPSVKIRLMKCRKNLKSSRDLKSVFINEDLTHTRNKIFFLARQLQKNKSVEQVWTTNGNIRLKDRHGRIYETNTIDRFLQVAVQLDPSYTLPE